MDSVLNGIIEDRMEKESAAGLGTAIVAAIASLIAAKGAGDAAHHGGKLLGHLSEGDPKWKGEITPTVRGGYNAAAAPLSHILMTSSAAANAPAWAQEISTIAPWVPGMFNPHLSGAVQQNKERAEAVRNYNETQQNMMEEGFETSEDIDLGSGVISKGTYVPGKNDIDRWDSKLDRQKAKLEEQLEESDSGGFWEGMKELGSSGAEWLKKQPGWAKGLGAAGAAGLGTYAISNLMRGDDEEEEDERVERKSAEEKSAYGADQKTLGDLLRMIYMDNSISPDERRQLIADLSAKTAGMPDSTPIKDILPMLGGGALGALVAKYFGAGGLGTAVAGGLGLGAGSLIGSRMKRDRPGPARELFNSFKGFQ